MESPAKRRRIEPSWESDEEDDDRFFQPEDASNEQDPEYQLQLQRAFADSRFQSTMAHIFEKYGRDFEGVGDEIDMMTGEIVVNNGHLKNMRDEGDIGLEREQESGDGDDEDEDEEGGLRLEDLLDEDQFEGTESEEDEEEEVHEEGHSDEFDADEEDGALDGREPGSAATSVAAPYHGSASIPPFPQPDDFASGPFGGINPLYASEMAFGGAASSLGFGASPLSFSHSPLAFNPWGQHLPHPQNSMWNAPDISQHQAMVNRMALQARQQRAQGTSIWTSGNRYESQLRRSRSLQPRSGVKTKVRPRKHPHLVAQSRLSREPGQDQDEEGGNRPRSMEYRQYGRREVMDSDDDNELPGPPQHTPLRDSRNQGNDKSPGQELPLRAVEKRRSRKRKMAAEADVESRSKDVELAFRSKSPTSSSRHHMVGSELSKASDRGRFGRRRKPVEHYSQLTWPASRQGKGRRRRTTQAAPEHPAARGEPAAPVSEMASSAAHPVGGWPMDARARGHSHGRTAALVESNALSRERVIPDSQDSLTPPTSSLPDAVLRKKVMPGLEAYASGDIDSGYFLSDDEMPMQVLSSRRASTGASVGANLPLSRKGHDLGRMQSKGAAPRRNTISGAMQPVNQPGEEGEWVLINSTKRPPYYRRKRYTRPAKEGPSEATLREAGPAPDDSGQWQLVVRKFLPPYYRRKRAVDPIKATTSEDNDSSNKHGPEPDDSGQWQLVRRTTLPPYYRRKRQAKPAGMNSLEDHVSSNERQQEHTDSREWQLILSKRRPAYYRRRRKARAKVADPPLPSHGRATRSGQVNPDDLKDARDIVRLVGKRGRENEIRWLLQHNGEESPAPESEEGHVDEVERDAPTQGASGMEAQDEEVNTTADQEPGTNPTNEHVPALPGKEGPVPLEAQISSVENQEPSALEGENLEAIGTQAKATASDGNASVVAAHNDIIPAGLDEARNEDSAPPMEGVAFPLEDETRDLDLDLEANVGRALLENTTATPSNEAIQGSDTSTSLQEGVIPSQEPVNSERRPDIVLGDTLLTGEETALDDFEAAEFTAAEFALADSSRQQNTVVQDAGAAASKDLGKVEAVSLESNTQLVEPLVSAGASLPAIEDAAKDNAGVMETRTEEFIRMALANGEEMQSLEVNDTTLSETPQVETEDLAAVAEEALPADESAQDQADATDPVQGTTPGSEEKGPALAVEETTTISEDFTSAVRETENTETAMLETAQTALQVSASPVVEETDHEDTRLGSPELGSPIPDAWDLPLSPPRISPSKALIRSPAKPSPLRKSHVPSATTNDASSGRKSVSPSKITKPSSNPRTPRSSPHKHRTPSSRRSLLSLACHHKDREDDDLDELSFAETPGSSAAFSASSVTAAASGHVKGQRSVSRRIWKATPRTTEVGSSKRPMRRDRPEEKGGLQEDVMRTPGGTIRTCGVDGFACGRDFCFTCL